MLLLFSARVTVWPSVWERAGYFVYFREHSSIYVCVCMCVCALLSLLVLKVGFDCIGS